MTDTRTAFFDALAPDGAFIAALPLTGFEPRPADFSREDLARVASAPPSRRREFLGGRLCARRALARLGHAEFPVGTGGDRRPVWPEGIVGSIAHTRAWCAAIVADGGHFRGLGIDLEPAEPVRRPTWRRILTPEERLRVDAVAGDAGGRIVRLLFSAKESAWKCRFPVDGVRFGFRDVEVRLDSGGEARFGTTGGGADSGTFRVVVHGKLLDGLSGRYRADADLIATVMSWPRREPAVQR